MENIDQEKTLLRLIIERLQNRYHQNRLRDRFLFYVILAFLLNCYIFWEVKVVVVYVALAGGISMGIVGGMIVGFLEWRNTIKRISGNIYKEYLTGDMSRILRIIIALSIAYLLYKLDLQSQRFYQLVVISVVSSFLVATLFMLYSLMRYEMKAGTVFIQKIDRAD